ncbi:MAG: hypothetical protein ACHQYP_10995 [Nitrospiria bacterium]
MKSFTILSVFIILVAVSIFPAFATESVRGYYKSNGTYVQPHIRTSPDHSPYNNYSYPGNINPNTGRTSRGNPETYLQRYYSPKKR